MGNAGFTSSTVLVCGAEEALVLCVQAAGSWPLQDRYPDPFLACNPEAQSAQPHSAEHSCRYKL